jgi:hypothetical protein
MKRVKVLVPFHSKATGKDQVPNDIIEVTDEQLAAIRAVNVNMVLVLGEVEEKADKKPKEKAEKADKKPKAKTK